MSNTFKFILLGILGIACLGFVFWNTRPQVGITPKVAKSEDIVKQLKNRSFYTKFPIVYSSDKLGKENPFK